MKGLYSPFYFNTLRRKSVLIHKEKKFFTLFTEQAENMYKGAKYFNELVTSGKFNEDTLAIMHRIEPRRRCYLKGNI
jgi:hypothetical protein